MEADSASPGEARGEPFHPEDYSSFPLSETQDSSVTVTSATVRPSCGSSLSTTSDSDEANEGQLEPQEEIPLHSCPGAINSVAFDGTVSVAANEPPEDSSKTSHLKETDCLQNLPESKSLALLWLL